MISHAEVHRKGRTRGQEHEERRLHCSNDQPANDAIPWGRAICNYLNSESLKEPMAVLRYKFMTGKKRLEA